MFVLKFPVKHSIISLKKNENHEKIENQKKRRTCFWSAYAQVVSVRRPRKCVTVSLRSSAF